jgi:hypothetical protein
MTLVEPGRFTRAAIHTDAGEVEVRLSEAGNWQLAIRGKIDREWRLACSGDLAGGAIAPPWDQREAPLRLGALTIDRYARRVIVADDEVRLSRRECELLFVLASDPGRVFTKEQLLRDVWGYRSLGCTAASKPTPAACASSCASLAPRASSSTATASATSSGRAPSWRPPSSRRAA